MNKSAEHHAKQSMSQRFAPSSPKAESRGGGEQGQISTRDGASHAYANEVIDVNTALNSLNHINGKRIPLLAAIALDKAYEALWSAKRAFDAFSHDER